MSTTSKPAAKKPVQGATSPRKIADQAKAAVRKASAPRKGPAMSEETKQKLASIPQESPEQAEARAKATVQRMADAKVEMAAVKAWEEAGSIGDRPATPNHDELEENLAKGITSVKGRARNLGSKSGRKVEGATSTRKGAEVVEPPKPAAGSKVVELRSEQAATEVARFLTEATGSTFDGRFLVQKTAKAQVAYDALATTQAATAKGNTMEGRRQQLALLVLRQVFPQITDERSTAAVRVVTALNEQGKSWSVKGRPDATPEFTIDGKVVGTTKAVEALLGLGKEAKASK